MEMETQDRLISFDVTNLFPQLSIDKAMKEIDERLVTDGSLRNGPASLHPSWLNSLNFAYEQPTSDSRAPASQLAELIELCL